MSQDDDGVRVLRDVTLVSWGLDPAYTNPWEAAQAAKCTCFLGNRDHSQGCRCTTTVMDCAVHAESEPGWAERQVVEQYYEGEP